MEATMTEPEARLAALIASQGVRPVEHPDEFVFRDWPDDESIDDFLAAVRAWRREGLDPA
jgi:hypothetical protein